VHLGVLGVSGVPGVESPIVKRGFKSSHRTLEPSPQCYGASSSPEIVTRELTLLRLVYILGA